MKAYLLHYRRKFAYTGGRRVPSKDTERTAYFTDKALLPVYLKRWSNGDSTYSVTPKDIRDNEKAPEVMVTPATNTWADKEKAKTTCYTHFGRLEVITS